MTSHAARRLKRSQVRRTAQFRFAADAVVVVVLAGATAGNSKLIGDIFVACENAEVIHLTACRDEERQTK